MADKNRTFKLVGAGSSSTQEKIEKPALSFMQDAWCRLKKQISSSFTLFISSFTYFFVSLKFICNSEGC